MGTQTYIKKPAFPKNKTIAFINLSTVGCGNKLSSLGGQDYPKLWQYFQDLEALPYDNHGRPRLDADLFLDKGIPSMTIIAQGAPSYARTRKDTADTINPNTMKELSKILYRAVLAMANSSQDFFEKR
jgi:Zn-dependent M28 family amino/carboxypeptidase